MRCSRTKEATVTKTARARCVALAVLLACPALLSPTAAQAHRRAHPPLHTQGRWIVERHGHHVKLAGVNWFGAESAEFVVGGLDKQPLSQIARTIRRGGFNSVRLPWSNQLVEENPVVAPNLLAANPRLQGKRALDVLDAVIRELGRNGLMVVLDNHRSRADWCCDEAHGDGLWYTRAYPESAWLADWKRMAARYRHFSNVVAAELRNEIRPDPSLAPGPTTATWGDGNPLTDWRAAAERGGDAVLSANPDLLVIVGGTEYQGNLTGVAQAPVRLRVPHRVVYAPHDYRWFHSDAELADYGAFKAKLDQRWGYILRAGIAPLYLSEFGTCTNPSPREQCDPHDPAFLQFITRYLRETDMDWAYWPLNGTQSAGYGREHGVVEAYGLLNEDWSAYSNRDVLAALQSVIPSWRTSR
jgi:endoglucanase